MTIVCIILLALGFLYLLRNIYNDKINLGDIFVCGLIGVIISLMIDAKHQNETSTLIKNHYGVCKIIATTADKIYVVSTSSGIKTVRVAKHLEEVK